MCVHLNVGLNHPKMYPQEVQRRLRIAQQHLRFVVSLYQYQLSEGRHFLHEHPAGALSWKEKGRQVGKQQKGRDSGLGPMRVWLNVHKPQWRDFAGEKAHEVDEFVAANARVLVKEMLWKTRSSTTHGWPSGRCGILSFGSDHCNLEGDQEHRGC